MHECKIAQLNQKLKLQDDERKSQVNALNRQLNEKKEECREVTKLCE